MRAAQPERFLEGAGRSAREADRPHRGRRSRRAAGCVACRPAARAVDPRRPGSPPAMPCRTAWSSAAPRRSRYLLCVVRQAGRRTTDLLRCDGSTSQPFRIAASAPSLGTHVALGPLRRHDAVAARCAGASTCQPSRSPGAPPLPSSPPRPPGCRAAVRSSARSAPRRPACRRSAPSRRPSAPSAHSACRAAK